MVLIAASVLVYSNTFSNPFIFDDIRRIVHNEQITQLFPLSKILTARPESRPIINLSLAVNYAISGLEPFSYHIFNFAVHVLAGITLFGIVRRTLISYRFGDDVHRAAMPLGLVVALIWLVHPLQTSAVSYISQRAESVMGLFYLLTLYCAIRSFAAWGRTRWAWYAMAIVSCAVGMGSKQVMLTAPLLVLVYDCVFAGRSVEKALRKRWVLYIGLAMTWLLLYSSVTLAFEHQKAGFGMRSMSEWEYARTQFGVILHYLRLSFWPLGLCLDYDWPVAETVWQVLPPGIVIAGLLALTVWALWRHPAAGFAGLWFFGVLSVSSTIIPIADLAFEHRMYLSLAGVVWLVVVGGYILGRWLLWRTVANEKAQNRLMTLGGAGVVLAVVAVLGSLAYARNAQYRSRLLIWLDVTTRRPDNPRARYNLGNHYAHQEKNEKAIKSYKTAIRLQGDYADAQYNLGKVMHKMKRYDQAIYYYEMAIQNRKTFNTRKQLARAYTNLGVVYFDLNQLDKAMPYYRRALEVKPNYRIAMSNLAWALATHPDDKIRNGPKAVKLAGRACAVTNYSQPDDLDTLAAAYAETGQFERAVETARRALLLASESGDKKLIKQFTTRLKLYEQHKPLRR